MENHRLASTAIPLLRLLVVNANGVQIRKNAMDHQSRASNASRSVPLIDRMRIKR